MQFSYQGRYIGTSQGGNCSVIPFGRRWDCPNEGRLLLILNLN